MTDYTEVRDHFIRAKISRLLSDMLDRPDERGIYPTSKFMWEMETYILKLLEGHKELKQELEDWKCIAEHNQESCHATVSAVVGVVGGKVEGEPTHHLNYLQRLRELVEIEKERDELFRLLQLVEWEGRDVEADERSCPMCKRWHYTSTEDQPTHAYRCSLGVALGSPCIEYEDKELPK